MQDCSAVSSATDRVFWVGVLSAAIAGVTLRVLYVLVAVDGRIRLTGDAETYHLLGRVLADGEGYVRPRELLDDGISIPTAEFPPLYPSTLAVLDLLGVDTPTGQRLVGALLGAITVVVVALLGQAVAGRVAGVVAGWLTALSPQLVVYDGALLSEGLYVALAATTLLAVYRARAAEGVAQLRWWVVAGAAVGLATLTRSEAVLLLPLLLVPATRAPGDPARWVRAALLTSAGVIVCVGAWTIRNAVSLDHVLPFTNNSGTLVAGANCDRVYTGDQIGLWRLDCVALVDVSGLDETEAAAERRRAGIDYATDHLERVPAVGAVRLARTFGMWDVRTQLYYESLEGREYHWLWAGWIGWLILAPLAVAGAVAQRRAQRLLWPLLVPVGIVAATALSAYGNQRFRALAEPSVTVLAATALAAAGSWVAGRRSESGPDDVAG